VRPIAILMAAFGMTGEAQTFSALNCAATAVPALVRLEGVTEQVGDIVLNCTGGTPNGLVRGDLRVISFGGNITNKLNPNTNAIDAVLTVNTGSGEMSTGATPVLRAQNQFDFSAMNFNLGPSGTAVFRLTNIRVVPPQTAELPFQLALATNGPSAIRIDNSPLTVGIATRALLATYSSSFFCTVSPAGAEQTFDSFLRAFTRFASIRFTEGFSESFRRREPLNDHGTRLMMRYSGFPAGSRLFVPDVLVGSTGTTPTAVGDLGLAPNGGRFQPGTPQGQLLLARVRNADASGAGGTLAYQPSSAGPAVDFGALGEIVLSNGSGIAVFEVVESDRTARESVQLPTFLVLEQRPAGGSVTASVAASFGPITTDGTASTGPVPRFQALNPPADCTALGDCNAPFFPRLSVDSEALTYNVIQGSSPQTRFIRVNNTGGGLLNWAANIQYRSGAGWLTIDPASGFGNATIRMDASAGTLAAGTYEAVLTIDAGPVAGRVSGNVSMIVRPFAPPPIPIPEVSSVVHAATFEAVPLAPGTIATIFGARLRGGTVTVNGVNARVFFTNDTQINFDIPPSLPVSGTVNLVVRVDDRPSLARAITLAAASPGIFPGAVLNQDFSPNSAANPALSGSVVQIFLTGLPSGNTKVRIHDYTVDPLYAAGAPGFIGLQQVNAMVPEALQSITSDISVCAGSACSPNRPITVRRP